MKITFGKVKKTLSILLAVFFIVAVTAGAASAGMWDKYKDPSVKVNSVKVKSVVAVANGAPGGDGGYATGGKVVIAPYNSASNDADFDASNYADVKQSNKLPVVAVAANPIVTSNDIFNKADSKAKVEASKAKYIDSEDVEADSYAKVKDVENDVEVEDLEAENEVYVYDNEQDNEADIDQNAEIDADVDQDANADQDVNVEDVYAYGGDANGGDGGDGGDENVVNVNIGAAQGEDNEIENENEVED